MFKILLCFEIEEVLISSLQPLSFLCVPKASPYPPAQGALALQLLLRPHTLHLPMVCLALPHHLTTPAFTASFTTSLCWLWAKAGLPVPGALPCCMCNHSSPARKLRQGPQVLECFKMICISGWVLMFFSKISK